MISPRLLGANRTANEYPGKHGLVCLKDGGNAWGLKRDTGRRLQGRHRISDKPYDLFCQGSFDDIEDNAWR